MIQHEMFPKLPDDWRVGRLLEVADTRTSNVDKHTVEGQSDIRLCNYVDVYYNEVISETIDFMRASASADQIARFRLQAGDTVITKDSETADDIGIPAYVEYEAHDLVCGYHLAIVRPYPQSIDPKYLYWVMRSDSTLLQWSVRATGVTRVGIKTNELARATIPIPPMLAQQAIAGYLNRETKRIDELIAEQHGLIETLRERRNAELSSVLVEGIAVPLKYVVHDSWPMTYGILQPGPILDDGVPYVSPHDLKGDRTSPLASLRRTTSEIERSYARSRIRGGEVLVSLGPGYGKVGVAPPEYNGVNIARDVARVSCDPSRALAEYVRLSLLTIESKSYWRQEIIGATFGRLNLNVLSRTPIYVPDLNRQAALVEQLDARLGQIDALIAESEGLISLSQERRAALITAAVTGQIDVRTAA